MRILLTTLGGFLLDLLFGDPEILAPIHPVVLMGRGIQFLEKRLRACFPETARGRYAAGLCMALLMISGTFLLSFGVLTVLRQCFPPLAFIVETLWCWQAIAARDLRTEALRVYDALTGGTRAQARTAVARIVGRDTETLDAAGIIRAAAETVAENFSDGVVAPLLYMIIGGAPLALTYKAVNTMDSMVGYRNERYRDFGRVPARIDDVANLIPSRLAAWLLIAAAAACGENAGEAVRIWRRDRRKSASPNAAQCEAVMAGALGLRLCGPASYFGKWYDKPFIGDDGRPAETEDIRRACRMEAAGSWFCLALLVFIRTGWLRL